MFAGGEAPLYETDATGTISETDIDGAGADVAHYEGPPTSGSTSSFFCSNGHGDLAAEADTSGARTNAYTYDPFGAPKQTQLANDNVERFTGCWDKKLDTTSSLEEERQNRPESTLARFLAPLDVYWTADPTSDASAPVPIEAGSLAEDLSDIYGALVAGLIAARDGRPAVAISTWSWSYWSYWGMDATEAMRALFAHARLQATRD